MMNVFLRKKGAPQVLFHYHTVLSNKFAFDDPAHVSARVLPPSWHSGVPKFGKGFT